MKIGYICVSTEEQNTARQEVLLRELGVDELFIDKASGKNADRPELTRMMNYVRRGDTVIVESISRFARNTRDLLDLVERLTEKQVEFVSRKEAIAITTPTGKFMLTVFVAVAKFERENVSNIAKVIVDAMRSGTISLAKNKEKFAQKQDKYAGFEGHKHTVAYIRLASLQELLTSVSGKAWTDSAVGKLLRENGLVEVGKDGHTAKAKFPRLGRFVPINKEKLEKQAKIKK